MPEDSQANSAFSFSMPFTGPGNLTHSGGVWTYDRASKIICRCLCVLESLQKSDKRDINCMPCLLTKYDRIEHLGPNKALSMQRFFKRSFVKTTHLNNLKVHTCLLTALWLAGKHFFYDESKWAVDNHPCCFFGSHGILHQVYTQLGSPFQTNN